MEVLKILIIAMDQIRFHKKTSLLVILLVSISTISMGSIIFYREIYDYSEKICENTLTNGIDQTGLIYIEDGAYYTQNAYEFLREAVESNRIDSIGCVAELETDKLPELYNIQKNVMGENSEELLQWIYMDETVIEMCDMSFSEQLDDDIEEKDSDRFKLFLGSDFKEISPGTEYHVQIDEETEYVYEVVGILEKGAHFISSNLITGNAAGATSSCITLDNRVIFVGKIPPPSAFWAFSVNERSSMQEGQESLSSLANKYGIKMQFSSLRANFNYNKMKGNQLQSIFSELFSLTFIATIIINLCLFMVSFINRMKDFGILYANGFSSLELKSIIVIENLLKCIISFFLSSAIVYIAGRKLFVYDLDTLYMVNSIYFNDFLVNTTLLALLCVFSFSIVPTIILNKYKPIALLKGTII